MSRAKKMLAAVMVLMLLSSLSACGGILRKGETAQEKAETQKEIEDAVRKSGIHGLPDGLKGSCVGDNPNLSSVSLETTGQYLSVEIPTPLMTANESLTYSIMFSDNMYNRSTQVGFKKVFATGDYVRFVYDMSGSTGQKTYPGDFATDFSAEKFSTRIPDSAIKGSEGVKWVAYLSVDGNDVATCPADGNSATLQ
ncbi:hypothetical protein BMYO_1824 [Bifidobacterium myosotis]|uniref:Lipoprotein n=1 Tax=Bifidobacterium myosotis TaxID=1630166 RepID=A0A261FF01_9BIFI|nr:hypothetical protein [Bifidobacterium myosotis]KAA8827777.1 hypothetical protein EMO91_08080 [Bifidobacterium myosotis]OZG57751.1 hypothetical protein BMYO_1824 [Bifidobacterium myosotis]